MQFGVRYEALNFLVLASFHTTSWPLVVLPSLLHRWESEGDRDCPSTNVVHLLPHQYF